MSNRCRPCSMPPVCEGKRLGKCSGSVCQDKKKKLRDLSALTLLDAHSVTATDPFFSLVRYKKIGSPP